MTSGTVGDSQASAVERTTETSTGATDDTYKGGFSRDFVIYVAYAGVGGFLPWNDLHIVVTPHLFRLFPDLPVVTQQLETIA